MIQLHYVVPNYRGLPRKPCEEVLDMLACKYDNEEIKHIGVTGIHYPYEIEWFKDTIEWIDDKLSTLSIKRLHVVQIDFNYLWRQNYECVDYYTGYREFIHWLAQDKGLAVIIKKPFASSHLIFEYQQPAWFWIQWIFNTLENDFTSVLAGWWNKQEVQQSLLAWTSMSDYQSRLEEVEKLPVDDGPFPPYDPEEHEGPEGEPRLVCPVPDWEGGDQVR